MMNWEAFVSNIQTRVTMLYQGYKDALVEIQTLKLKCSSERMRSEALNTACNDLKLGSQM